MEKNIFQKIIDKEVPSIKIYEDEKHYAFLDIRPFSKGHTLVIPKKSYKFIHNMPEDEYLELQKVVLKLTKHYKKILNTEIGTLTFGLDIPHVHIHIFPINTELKIFNFNNVHKYKDETEANSIAKKLQLTQ